MTPMDSGSLLARMGRRGVTSACVLAPSAFLASAAATLSRYTTQDLTVTFALSTWKTLKPNPESINGIRHIQRVWDVQVAHIVYPRLQTKCETPADMASLKAVAAPHAGDWLKAPPLAAIGLCLSDEWIRVAVGFRLGCMPT